MDPAGVDGDRRAVTSFHEAHPMIFDGTRRTVSLAAWLYDMELIFRLCHIEERLQVSLASRCLAVDARLWWMTIGERAMPSRTWAHFRALIVARFGPLPDEGVPHRDPVMYRETYRARYLSFAVVWHAFPDEPMSHYCRRFQEEMLPYVPQDLENMMAFALQTFRDGLPQHIRQYVPMPLPGSTVEHMIADILEAEAVIQAMQEAEVAGGPQAPVDDAGMGEPFLGPGPVFPEDPIPAEPVQAVPAQDVEADGIGDDFDPDEFIDAPEDQPEDPPIIDIPSDEEEDMEPEPEPEQEPEQEDWVADDEEDLEPGPEFEPEDWQEEDFDEDPEEFPLHDGDDDADSDAPSVVTDEDVD